MTEASIIRDYPTADVGKRIHIIFYNLPKFRQIMTFYKNVLIRDVIEQTEYNRKQNHSDLGVRVQSGGVHSDVTAKMAITRATITDMIENGNFSEDILDYVDDRIDITNRVVIYLQMKDEYEIVNEYVSGLYGKEKKLIDTYLSRDYCATDVATEFGVEVGSLYVRLNRIMHKMQDQIEPLFQRNSERGVA